MSGELPSFSALRSCVPICTDLSPFTKCAAETDKKSGMLSILGEQFHDLFGKVADDQIGAGAFDGGEGFEDCTVAIKPAISEGRLEHRVFATDLVGDEGDIDDLADAGDDVEVGPRRLDHDHIG